MSVERKIVLQYCRADIRCRLFIMISLLYFVTIACLATYIQVVDHHKNSFHEFSEKHWTGNGLGHNEPLFNEVLVITNYFLYPRNSKIFENRTSM